MSYQLLGPYSSYIASAPATLESPASHRILAALRRRLSSTVYRPTRVQDRVSALVRPWSRVGEGQRLDFHPCLNDLPMAFFCTRRAPYWRSRPRVNTRGSSLQMDEIVVAVGKKTRRSTPSSSLHNNGPALTPPPRRLPPCRWIGSSPRASRCSHPRLGQLHPV